MWMLKKSKLLPVAALVALSLSACGKNHFEKVEQSQTATAGQYTYIKPKLDLVIFEDNSDSLFNAMDQVKPQLTNFINSLNTNWEYRVIVMPLFSQQSINSKVVLASDCSGVPANCTTSASTFNSYAGNQAWINVGDTSIGNSDPGFSNMKSNYQNLLASGFVRSDAVLATVVFTNGEDRSGVSYAMNPDGSMSSNIDYNSATTINSFNNYKGYFQGLKASPALNKFYSVAAAAKYSNCYNGGQTWAGKRYFDMAGALGGASWDLCAGALPSVMSDISSQMQTVVQVVEFNYVVLTEQPNPSTIKLTKNGATIPNDSNNGWTYAGYLQNQATSFAPVSGNIRTGYMIRLNGTATFKGSDAITINYQKN